MTLKEQLINMAKGAREACGFMAGVPSGVKNRILKEMAAALIKQRAFILRENKKDCQKAGAAKLSAAFIDRLRLSEKRIAEMSKSLLAISRLSDPVGQTLEVVKRPNGLRIHKVRVPIGVIAIIYESRPNVTSDCIGLSLKSANSVILRGGSDALNSNLAIYRVIKRVLQKHRFPEGIINIIKATQRSAIDQLVKLNDYIDLVIPRGGESLIRRVVKLSRIPVIKHFKGVCHVYVDEWADLNKAQSICFNAKVQRPGVCNAMESMLVHKDVAMCFLPGMVRQFKQAGVQIRGCALTQKIAKGAVKRATDKDYRTEYLDLILSVKVVGSLGEAIGHINSYGSHHSDAIVTDNYDAAMCFLRQVDSACVYLNASTRFTDGNQFGMGAEIGISTDKLHARGPMSLAELTTYKYMVFGNGQVRE
ncbi:MAG: glutamate-5-semialdehyde dehydrogenase [Candidatus Omnitrophota bacterium]